MQVSAPAEPIPRSQERKETRTSPAERSGGGISAPRTVKIPLVYDAGAWKRLRNLAYVCAHFGNELLSASYVRAKLNGHEPTVEELSPYTDYNDRLSSYCRDAVARECVGIWRRCGRDVLSGKRSLPTFSADRALVVRERGVKIEKKDGCYWVRVAVEPARSGEPVRLTVSNRILAIDKFLEILMRRLEAGTYPITKATAIFNRGKMRLLLTYDRPLKDQVGGGVEATVGPVEDGICAWVKCAGRSYGITDSLARIAELKDKYAAIRARLQLINSNRNRRREWRQKFLHAKSFEGAVTGPLHRLSREIVDFSFANGAKSLVWNIEHDKALPWDRLRQMVEYKCEECGIAFSQTGKEEKRGNGLRKKVADGASNSREKTEIKKKPH